MSRDAGKFQDVLRRVQAARADHIGYPYNLTARSPVPAPLSHCLINNVGDPFTGSNFGSDVHDLEREVVHWFMKLWDCEDPDTYWGSVVASGTEGNLWALYLGREALPNATLVHSDAAHYSIAKASRILRMPARTVATLPSGAIDIAALRQVLTDVGHGGVVLALTCGTTMTGAHDDIADALAALDTSGVTPDRRFVHVDGALDAMVVPFLSEAPHSIVPGFRLGIDSVSTSGHKMIGTEMPCGVLVARRSYAARVAETIPYLRSDDTTLMGSRNGHAVLSLWARLNAHGRAGFAADAGRCHANAMGFTARLLAAGVPARHNPFALTVVFPQPPEALTRRYQLASQHGLSHAVLMPSVSDDLVDRFLADYLDWWTSADRSVAGSGA